MGNDVFGRYSDPSILILASLAGGEKHGYAMMEDIAEIASVKLGPGTLYGAISRLEKSGLIQALETDDRRRPYRITSAGEMALRDYLTSIHKVATLGLHRLGAI
ncbi:PadR family transcriptional regulator [Paenibacillus ginsengarvi]|uniref:PadR family transcriptional regulator n=1 Tax=Paenibacillus ginsengarvi TaxID=400777 RepID=A0A3B0C7Z3_9BACL|nr:PadR family transcriptional regulator [Paenibacillus ginsengarvi]RKN80618.1 PadR family transcriptional regulator [Paenibacillus ginsengarvi]